MRKNPEYTTGWIDSDVHHFLMNIGAPPASMAHALITCLDSNLDLPVLVRKSPELRASGLRGRFVGTSLLVRTKDLLAAERRERLFFGFDEVWFFSRSVLRPKPKKVCLIGPEKLTHPLSRELVTWMHANGCSLGLGDGCGLNFVTKLSGVARYIVDECVEAANGYAATGTSKSAAARSE